MEIVEREFGRGTLSLETGRLARQANGSVLVRYGDTMVLVAATAAPGAARRPQGQDHAGQSAPVEEGVVRVEAE